MTNALEAFGGIAWLQALRHHIDVGNVSERQHPDLPLNIYNYTPQCAYSREWDDVTLNCRGLILDDNGFVVARPFPKFFNLGEHEQFGNLPDHPPAYVYDKMDGSLGIAYQYDGHIGVATRGSFTSDQALWATEWLLQTHPEWTPDEGITSLFEIIYPDNRIVVNYGERAEMVLLGRVSIENGVDFPVARLSSSWSGAIVDQFSPRKLSILVDQANQRDNAEGFVCVWPQKGGSALRIKIKSDDYVAMHRIVTGLSNRIVWEHLGAGTVDDLRDTVPDELYEWFDEQVELLQLEFERIYDLALSETEGARYFAGEDADRKTLAKYVKMTTNPGLCFALLDNKDIGPMIWKMIRPTRETPITTIQEEA